jgi:transcription elongation factor SPT6
VAPEKLLIHLERALVSVVNEVGVEINRAIGHTHVQKMLPFLSGLGPRKVERLLKGIQRAVSLGAPTEQRRKTNIVPHRMARWSTEQDC